MISMSEKLIIDFHTHVLHSWFSDLAIGTERAITIPFEIPKGWTWRDMGVVAGMHSKPKKYLDWLINRLPLLNAEWYQQVQRINANTHNPHVPLIFVPWISLTMNVEQIKKEEWFQKSQIVKFIPVFDDVHGTTIKDQAESSDDSFLLKMHRFVGQLPQKGIMIHTGWGSAPVYYNNLIGNYSDKIFILAHMKEDDDSDNIERQAIMTKYHNVYLEMSYLSSPKRLAQYVKKGWGDRILYGSDWRSSEDECTLKWTIDAVKLAPISNEDRNRIFYGNAVDLLHKIDTIS